MTIHFGWWFLCFIGGVIFFVSCQIKIALQPCICIIGKPSVNTRAIARFLKSSGCREHWFFISGSTLSKPQKKPRLFPGGSQTKKTYQKIYLITNFLISVAERVLIFKNRFRHPNQNGRLAIILASISGFVLKSFNDCKSFLFLCSDKN